MRCGDCGAELDSGENSCPVCGWNVPRSSARTGHKIRVAASPPIQPYSDESLTSETPELPRESMSSSRKIVMIVSLAIGLIFLSFIVYDEFFALADDPDLEGWLYFRLDYVPPYYIAQVTVYGHVSNSGPSSVHAYAELNIFDDYGHSIKNRVDLGHMASGATVNVTESYDWKWTYNDDPMQHIDVSYRLLS